MSFTQRQREDLEAFVQRAEMVDRTELVRTLRSTSSTELRFEFTPAALTVSGHRADDAALERFLMAFRPFTLQNERITLKKIFDLLELHLTSNRLRGAQRKIRSDWKQAQKGSIPFLFNTERVTAEDVLDLAMNGHYFHLDHDKRQLWLQLTAAGPAGAVTDFQLLNLLHDGAFVVILTANVILEALKTGGFS